MKKDGFEYILNEVIPRLQDYEPAKNLWERISSILDFEVEVKKSMPNLATYSPDVDLWSRIDKQINPRIVKEKKIVNLLRVPVSIAAIFLLIITIYFAFNQNRGIRTTYSEEVAMEWQNIQQTVEFDSSMNPERFILEACSKHSFICETEEFKEKWALLSELNQNLHKINGEIDRYGTSVSLEKSKIKLENLKSQVVKEMIKHIVS